MLALMKMAHDFDVPRLVSLCELKTSLLIDVAVRGKIEKAEVDVVGILNLAHELCADQLATFCRFFISSNYGPMSKRKEFANLTREDAAYVEAHQWPPKSYFAAVSVFEEEMKRFNAAMDDK